MIVWWWKRGHHMILRRHCNYTTMILPLVFRPNVSHDFFVVLLFVLLSIQQEARRRRRSVFCTDYSAARKERNKSMPILFGKDGKPALSRINTFKLWPGPVPLGYVPATAVKHAYLVHIARCSWLMVDGLWFMVYGSWFMVHGWWAQAYDRGERGGVTHVRMCCLPLSFDHWPRIHFGTEYSSYSKHSRLQHPAKVEGGGGVLVSCMTGGVLICCSP